MDISHARQPKNSPVRQITVGSGTRRLAVALSGDFDQTERLPIVCIPGYHRNMEDYAAFAAKFSEFSSKHWPIARVDLLGRGHASHAPKSEQYSTLDDAEDIAELCKVLGIHRAIFFGQAHGGNVIMALGKSTPTLIAGAILCDAGAIINAQGLVRLRNNLKIVAKIRNKDEAEAALRQIFAADYPSLGSGALDAIAQRTHVWNSKRKRMDTRFDWRLIERLDTITNDDILNANWELFDSLAQVPLFLLRTQNTDLMRADVYQRMLNRRPDALALEIVGEGSPALMEQAEEMGAIAEFVQHTNKNDKRR